MADRRQSKSKYTADRGIPGAFEGETVTRRRFMTGTAHTRRRRSPPPAFALPALGFALGPMFEKHGRRWQAVGAPDDFPDDTYVPTVSRSSRASARPARATVYVRKRNPQIDTEPQDQYNRVRRDLDALHAPRLPGALRRGRRALHLPVPRRRLRLPGRARGGPPVRPLDRFYTRVEQRPGRGRPALQRQQRAASASRRATRASRSTASASTSTRRALDVRKRPGDLSAWPRLKLPAPAAAAAAQAAARAAPATGNGTSSRRSSTRPRPASPSSTGSTSAPRCRAASRWLMFRKVPKGTNWFYTLGSATMFAFLIQAVTGVFLAMYYDPSPTRRLRVGRATSPTRSSSASSCAACTSGARR